MAKNVNDIVGGIWVIIRVLIGFTPLTLIFVYGFHSLLFVYVFIGIIFFVVTRYLKFSEANWFSDLSAGVIIWPVLILLWKEIFKPEKRTMLNEFDDLVDRNPILKMQKEYFSVMNKDGTTEDVIPNGIGRFGLDVTNPIPTNNIFGSNAYLGRLRDKNGNPIKYERLGSTSAFNVSNPIDSYKISDFRGTELVIIYISPYQKIISRKAPEGFIIK